MASISNSADVKPVVALRGVSKHYGAVHAVREVDLDVRPGEIFGLIGHNGAGKSTLFKMMLGLAKPTAGAIEIYGQAVNGAAFREVRRRIGYLPESLALYDNLSGLETLQLFARLKKADAGQCTRLLERLGLGGAARRPVRDYSKGMRQRLGFAQALLGEPGVIFLDEPTNGLDPLARRDFFAQLAELRGRGVTLIISSHVLSELQAQVDRLAIMADGRLLALGSVAALREQMALPVLIEIQPAPGLDGALHAELHRLPGVTVQSGAGSIVIECPRPLKMQVIAALTPLATRLGDLNLHEPSLEDVYFSARSELGTAQAVQTMEVEA